MRPENKLSKSVVLTLTGVKVAGEEGEGEEGGAREEEAAMGSEEETGNETPVSVGAVRARGRTSVVFARFVGLRMAIAESPLASW